MKNIGIFGLGLIGGSMGLALRHTGRYRVFGTDRNPEHLRKALERGLADAELRSEDIAQMDGIILAVPADVLPGLARRVLDQINPQAWVFDTGSVKSPVIEAVQDHPRRGCFVAAHPIAGTEYSGPEAAFATLFEGKINILCNPGDSDADALDAVTALFEHDLGMDVYHLDATLHDVHIAYVSHLSHVSAFTLGKTVLDVEHDQHNIFLMAGSGFGSTVRLAKSSPDTWTPVLLQNRRALLPVLKTYGQNLKLFIDLLEKEDAAGLHRLLGDINRIGQIIDRITRKHGKQ